MTFGEKLKKQAHLLNLTSAEVGEIIDRTPSQVRNWYTGKRMPNNATVDDIFILSKVFGTDMEYWLSDDIDEKVVVALTTKKAVLMQRESHYSDMRRSTQR